jgi:hypothetical protein
VTPGTFRAYAQARAAGLPPVQARLTARRLTEPHAPRLADEPAPAWQIDDAICPCGEACALSPSPHARRAAMRRTLRAVAAKLRA